MRSRNIFLDIEVMLLSYNEVSIKTPEYVSLRFQSANLGSRALAFIIDSLIVAVAQVIVLILAVLSVGGFESFFSMAESGFLILALVIIIFFIINYGYFIFFEYFNTGQTPGKRVVGIRVIQDNGHNITMLSSVIRNLMRIIDSLPSAYFIGIIMVFFHAENKRLGDLVAGTIVVHERPGKRKETKLDKLLRERNLPLPNLTIDELSMRSVGPREWNLLKVYSERFTQVTEEERIRLTRDLAEILLPKFHINPETRTYAQLEDILLSLYVLLREEWDFE